MAAPSSLWSIFNHVEELMERDLIRRMLETVVILKENCELDLLSTWQMIENTLKLSSLANDGAICYEPALIKVFKKISPESSVFLRILEQNAGLLIRRSPDTGPNVIIEAFETSPTAEQALSAKGALQWDFPGAAVSVPNDVFDKPEFHQRLASFLEKASGEYLDQFSVKVRKAGVDISEDRNTAHPAIITQFLMTLLEVNGERISLPALRKRVKDDVCWDNASLPWRRSPFWLVLRVSVQRLLYLHLGSEAGRIQYKALMCLFLARLLSDCVRDLSSDKYELLKVKLCRRLAKLDSEKESLGSHASTVVPKVVGFFCTKSIDVATTALENEWKNWKRDFQRRVPKLPARASSEDHRLELPNSLAYLQEFLKPAQHRHSEARAVDPTSLRQIAEKNTSKEFSGLVEIYSSLALREMLIEFKSIEIPSSQEATENKCVYLALTITEYINASFILTIFDLWVAMDKCATVAYPLLSAYHPWFTSEILDVLLLPRWKQLKRLQAIQSHLHLRCASAKHDRMTIFAGPERGCFAERYVESPGGSSLEKLGGIIKQSSATFRRDKQAELERTNRTYDDLTEKLKTTPCTQIRKPDESHDIRGCRHCFYMRSRRRLQIQVHEDFLPMRHDDVIQQRSIMFELKVPRAFAAYREATWNIVNRLCPELFTSTQSKAELLLSEYAQLKNYYNHQKDACFSLASRRKSFLKTHYGYRSLPARTDNVLLPHGLTWSYYDSKRKRWSVELPEQLSFAHHFVLDIPKELPLSALYSTATFAPDGPGPSSYEVTSSIGECPSELTIHEYLAHQNLIGGRNRRWLSILAELGSSNINFTLYSTTTFVHHLAFQAGPRLTNDSMRTVHVMFRDLGFCSRLAEQISRHLEAISTNWRETNYMETLLTLSIPLFSLGHQDSRAESKKLLLRIRKVTAGWISLLRNETARYCFLSALLCRRTFSPFLTSRSGFDIETLSLVVDLSEFSTQTRNLLVRDIKMATLLSPLLRAGVERHPNSLGMAIDTVWPNWKLLPSPYDNWATSTTHVSEGTSSQVFFFHLLEGHLVINGQTVGKLPADIRDSGILKELFGNQRLFAQPSSLRGMDYLLSNRAENHHIHLGYRDKRLIIQARLFDNTLELIPRCVFGAGPDLDLPLPLIADCLHWLDLKTGSLEIRQKPRIWAKRLTQRRGSTLVDPFSKLAQEISRIFLHFEDPSRLTLFQPPRGKLSVEMKRRQLDFFVTNGGQLECRQLRAVVDRHQDAGTLYGLQSMLVLRDADDYSQRSIITPIGQVVYQHHRGHVLVKVEGTSRYARYTINDLLGRFECPAEPGLLYAKAQLHAFTSHLLPDPLTGRTGTQEALACLESGYCQPWAPLDSGSLDILTQLSNLTPRREHYPKDKQCQQTVLWDSQLPTNIQSDEFQLVVDKLIAKSNRLSQFSTDEPHITLKAEPNDVKLLERARWRRSIYATPDDTHQKPTQPEDLPLSNAREIVTLLYEQPLTIHTTRKLLNLFEYWPSIGGYAMSCDLYDIGEYLSVDLAEQWGALVNICRQATDKDVYDLMFQLGAIAFRADIDMTIIRVIASFFILRELQSLEFPQYLSFKPTTDMLLAIIRISYLPSRATNPSKKGKGKVPDENTRFGNNENCEKESLELAQMLVRQWPCAQPSVHGFEAAYIDVSGAMKALLPEWQRMHHNAQLQRHIIEAQTVLNSHYRAANSPVASALPNGLQKKTIGPSRRSHFSIHGLEKPCLKAPSQDSNELQLLGRPRPKTPPAPSSEILELEIIAQKLGQSDCSVKSMYAEDLNRSILALKMTGRAVGNQGSRLSDDIRAKKKLDKQVASARAELDGHYRRISDALSANDTKYKWLRRGNLWPRLTPITILQQLRSTSPHQFGPGMRGLFITYALCTAQLQKLLRMREAFTKHDMGKLSQERADQGHINWDPKDFPDWLLLEIDANIRIRKDQIVVAKEMISPASGKTSVIMPMVASVLANGEMLNRLLIFQARLGGLLGREIIHVPFSRRTRTTVSLINDYHELHNEILDTSGIVLGIPEHCLADSKLAEADCMIRSQKWMDKVCRDVLDECDFTLAVKTQLIYPGGAQLAVDGYPNRWEVAMTVLGLVALHLKDLARDYPRSLDILKRNSTGFPVTHILRKDVEEALISKIVNDIWKRHKEAIKIFISQEKVEKSIVKRVASLFPDIPKARKIVYLLRGLLKRWNVQYGLHHGVPSDQAEWGHPDVAILFTCLAFYYEGLSVSQFRQSLEAYDRWTETSSTLPGALRHWNAITVDDVGLVTEIWRHLRFTPVVINHFLTNFLQASGWDVLLYSNLSGQAPGEIRPGITTGFSGTNDNRRLLPLTIEQCDLQSLSHTNAEVLTYLLQPRNRGYRVTADQKGRRLSEVDLLKSLHIAKIRILIDAGAFIMEMNNFTVAWTWLQEDWEAHGAVYFSEDNKPWVVYRNSKHVPLFASPFADDIHDCVVYLDEAHTRGTDLKLPPDALGALTLGLSQTKDHTVQAAMRLRQLGTTQSVRFLAPPEVHQSILDVCKKSSNDTVDSSDGKDFFQRIQAAAIYNKFLSNPEHRKAYLDVLQLPEQQTLEQLYEPYHRSAAASRSADKAIAPWGRIAILMKTLGERRQESQAYESILSSVLKEVEQEREVAYEIEEEREIQRPRKPNSLKFPGLLESIISFARGGLLVLEGIVTAAKTLEATQLGLKYHIQGASLVAHLYLSVEFSRTIKLKTSGEKDDTYTRPVTWFLHHPEEAEALIPVMREHPSPDTHLIMYAAPWTKAMLHFNNLDYYALPSLPDGWRPPSWLPFEIGILGGRLYFEFSEYEGILAPIRRQGQDISDTPMGYVCQDWQLRSDHPFFTTRPVSTPEENGPGLESLRFEVEEDREEEYYTSDDGVDEDMMNLDSSSASDYEDALVE
ncbi:hypothetical protein BJY00DRAFT_320561 [Aspergillus carlsbadensis]|nr:hypothetical protein BJY00DRAFT_320561 [Aspergillus carlsbadensis]